MSDRTRQDAEYEQWITERQRWRTDIIRAYRKLDLWPELENNQQRQEETQAYQEFKTKLDGFAASGEGERREASVFWDSHMPKEYAKPAWHESVDETIIEAIAANKARDVVSIAWMMETPIPEADTLIANARNGVAELRGQLERHYDGLAEDSYATRMEAREDLRFIHEFERAIAGVKSGDVIDLRRVGIDYGYDPEEAFSDRSVGLEYVPPIEQERRQFDRDMGRVQPFINSLEEAGVIVRREFREVRQDEHESRIFGSDQTSLNRYLDLQERLPALINVQYDLGIRRMWLEERFERVANGEPETFMKAEREFSFVGHLEYAVSQSRPGQVIDLRVVGVHDGQEYGLAALNLPKELPLVHTQEYSRSEYSDHVAIIETYIHRLEEVGITVRTGYREVLARDYAQDVRVEQSAPGRDQGDLAVGQPARQSPALDAPRDRKSLRDEATMYWSAIAETATAKAGLQQSESLIQTAARGRAR